MTELTNAELETACNYLHCQGLECSFYVALLKNHIDAITAELAQARAENAELNAGFDLRFEADARAIQMWRETTGQRYALPDQADLCGYLLMRLDMADQGLAASAAMLQRWEDAAAGVPGKGDRPTRVSLISAQYLDSPAGVIFQPEMGGWRLTPKDPTDDMLEAGGQAYEVSPCMDVTGPLHHAYSAMLQTAPNPTAIDDRLAEIVNHYVIGGTRTIYPGQAADDIRHLLGLMGFKAPSKEIDDAYRRQMQENAEDDKDGRNDRTIDVIDLLPSFAHEGVTWDWAIDEVATEEWDAWAKKAAAQHLLNIASGASIPAVTADDINAMFGPEMDARLAESMRRNSPVTTGVGRTEPKPPPPGSADALAAGCTCPTIDNCYGKGARPDGKGGMLYWYSADCPVHTAAPRAS